MNTEKMRIMKPITQKAKLSPAERKKIFKVLDFKNQTEYVKALGIKKEDAIRQAIIEYNNEIKKINKQIKQTRKENRALSQYGQRLEKTLKTFKTTYTGFTLISEKSSDSLLLLQEIQAEKDATSA